jgi:hypothetical protein
VYGPRIHTDRYSIILIAEYSRTIYLVHILTIYKVWLEIVEIEEGQGIIHYC